MKKDKPKTIKDFNKLNQNKEVLDQAYSKLFPEFKKPKQNLKKKEDIFEKKKKKIIKKKNIN